MTRTLAPILFALLLLVPGCIEHAGSAGVSKAVAFLVAAQNTDGGYGAVLGGPSDFSTSSWAALGLVAGDGPAAAREHLRNYLANQSWAVMTNATGSFSRVNPVSLYVLAGLALGVPQAQWNGTDPVARLRVEAQNASLGRNEKIFLLGALSRVHDAAADPVASELRANLTDLNATDLATDAWTRSAAILALLAYGDHADTPEMRANARSLHNFHKIDSGFFSDPQYDPDASTTAAVLAVVWKVPFIYSDDRPQAQLFLENLQQPDGSVKFSETLDFSRVKTTSEAILGWTAKGPFGV